MKASEFITEANKIGKVRQGLEKSGPAAKRYDQLDTFYDMYRLGIALANHEAPRHGAVSHSPTVWVRGPEEEEMLAKAERSLGLAGTVIVPSGPSEEMPSVGIVSPVAKPKRNKYGV